MNKVQLRKHVANIISNIPKNEKQLQSQSVFQKLIEHPRYKDVKRLSIYLSTENEIDTKPILKHAFENRKQCFIPLVRKTRDLLVKEFGANRMLMIELKSMKEFDELPTNSYGIKEPVILDVNKLPDKADPQDVSKSLDLIIVPGVAFSRNGGRLGHGKGYYDEYLNYWTKFASSDIYTIGIGFKEQLFDENELPMVADHDFILDEIIVPDNSYKTIKSI